MMSPCDEQDFIEEYLKGRVGVMMKRLVSLCLDRWCLWMLWSGHLVEHEASAFAVPHTAENRRHLSFSALLSGISYNLLECLSTTNGVLFLAYTACENHVSFTSDLDV